MKDEVSHEIVESILIEAGLIEKTYIEESLYTGTRNAFLFILAAIVSPIGIPLFGHVIQQRINSMYYECKSIKDPSEKKNCRLKLLNFVVNIQKQKLKDPKLTDKQRKKLVKSISLYEEAKKQIISKGKGKFAFESSSSLKEAATGIWWKTLLSALTIPSMAIYTSAQDEAIQNAKYHCKELPIEERKQCQLKVLKLVISILQEQAKKEPKNKAILRKLRLVHAYMAYVNAGK